MKGNKSIQVTDVTLRDGSYGIMHQYTKEQVAAITKGLADAGVKIIEVGHGDGVGGSTITYGRALLTDDEIYTTAAANKGDSELQLVDIPGVATMERIERAFEQGVTWSKASIHATEYDVMEQHIRQCKKIGMKVAALLSSSHVLSMEEMEHHCLKLEEYGADLVYIADSCGTMFPEEVAARISLLKEKLSTRVGFHGHSNLGMGIANSVAAANAGADVVDGACRGMGAGAGNAQIEVLVAALHRYGYETGIDLYKLMDVAEDIVEPVLTRPQTIRNNALMIGYVGTYGSFLLHAERAAEKYGLDPRDIIMELGRRNMVMGQEDMVIDIAYELANK